MPKINFYVVDADGRRIFNGRKTFTSKKPTTPSPVPTIPSQKQLEELEEAVFQDEDYRVRFLDLVHEDVAGEKLGEFLCKLICRKERTLLHCWKILKWRPSTNGKKVVIVSDNNRYRKN